eukprot:jgi/Mesen1/9830/ME000007S09875
MPEGMSSHQKVQEDDIEGGLGEPFLRHDRRISNLASQNDFTAGAAPVSWENSTLLDCQTAASRDVAILRLQERDLIRSYSAPPAGSGQLSASARRPAPGNAAAEVRRFRKTLRWLNLDPSKARGLLSWASGLLLLVVVPVLSTTYLQPADDTPGHQARALLLPLVSGSACLPACMRA